MKHKTNIIIFALMLLSISASAQIQFTAGLNYESGVPSGAPSSTGSRIRVNLATGRAYIWNQAGSNWRVLAQGIDIVAGCSAPLYTPGYGQSLFAVNGCASPELYYYTGTAWVQINAGGGSTDALRLKFIVVNKSGGTLNKGEVVYVSGAQGNRVAVKKALASADSLSANTLGVMDETVADNGEGYCIAEGLVSGINTSAFTEGAALYLSPTTAGAITQTKPTAPNHLVLIGYCVKSNAGSGEISVHIQNGYELGELHDVYVPAPTNGQVLTYDTTNTRWQAATVADQSATNELQTIDTFSLSGQTLSASLLNDGVPASSVTLPIVDVVAGTNVTVTKSNGVATVSATGGGGGGTPAGSAGQVQFNSTPAGSFDASANLAWDNANVRLNVGAPSAPTGRLNVKGGGATSSTVNLRLTNSGNTELFKVNDDASSNFGAFAYVDPANSRMALNTSTYDASTVLTSNGTIRATNFFRYNNTAANGISFAGGANVDVYSNGIGRARFSTVCNLGNLNSGTGAMANIRGANTAGTSLALGVENSTPTTLFTIANNGKISYLATNTAAGTTGAQTIDKPSGTVNFGIGDSALVVTNSLCTTSSIVFATVRTNDATAYIKNVVPAAGSFTINLGANATAETSVGFFIIN